MTGAPRLAARLRLQPRPGRSASHDRNWQRCWNYNVRPTAPKAMLTRPAARPKLRAWSRRRRRRRRRCRHNHRHRDRRPAPKRPQSNIDRSLRLLRFARYIGPNWREIGSASIGSPYLHLAGRILRKIANSGDSTWLLASANATRQKGAERSGKQGYLAGQSIYPSSQLID